MAKYLKEPNQRATPNAQYLYNELILVVSAEASTKSYSSFTLKQKSTSTTNAGGSSVSCCLPGCHWEFAGSTARSS